MLSRPDAQRLAALLEKIADALPSESGASLEARLKAARGVLAAYALGGAFDRQPVATAVVYLELEMRRLRWGREGGSAERERLWVEIDAIAGSI